MALLRPCVVVSHHTITILQVLLLLIKCAAILMISWFGGKIVSAPIFVMPIPAQGNRNLSLEEASQDLILSFWKSSFYSYKQ
ncbi:hypothetical protein VNO77_09554 [Canavalia gladiata]|uniref:Uncharacterized protein n=1 Tax=Canavalia gladiata TaxID=3824 RepID=A0AAN9MEU7_CANGL